MRSHRLLLTNRCQMNSQRACDLALAVVARAGAGAGAGAECVHASCFRDSPTTRAAGACAPPPLLSTSPCAHARGTSHSPPLYTLYASGREKPTSVMRRRSAVAIASEL